MKTRRRKAQSLKELDRLTPREVEIVELRCQDLELDEIGEQLKIAEGTVKSHLNHIYSKWGIEGSSAIMLQRLKEMWAEHAAEYEPSSPISEQGRTEKPQGPGSNADTKTRRNTIIAGITILVVIVVALILWALPNLTGKLRPWTPTARSETSTPFVTSTPSSTATPIPTPTPTPEPTRRVCGETYHVQSAPATRLLRDQGVEAYTQENTDGAVLNNYVRAIAVDERGVWFGYFRQGDNPRNGLGHFDGSTWFDCDHTGATAGDVNAVATDGVGRVWVGTEKNGIAMFDGDEWHRFTTADGLLSDWIYGITIDDTNTVWAATWEGVARYDGASWSVPYNVSNGTLFNDHVHAIAFDSALRIWVGHIDQGISLYASETGEWTHYTAQTSGLGGNNVRSIVVRPASKDAVESVWVATDGGGVTKFENGTWMVYTVDDGLPSDKVSSLAMDRYGRIWVASNGGVAYLEKGQWVTYNTLDTRGIAFGPECEDCPYDQDHVWTATATSGITHSRLPYPDEAIDIVEVCFRTADRKPICPPLDEIESSSVLTATYPAPLAPGDAFTFEIAVMPRSPYRLQESDFLSNADLDANAFGAWPVIPVEGSVEPGQPFVFTDANNPIVAPQLGDGVQDKTFLSRWRVWMDGRYAGPTVHILFTVKGQ
ncbi:MAG: hypothetical protein JXA14_17515 [Anaerolineae bacterium]|nr:hypothetical protein [Anaerolineae bacterium]